MFTEDNLMWICLFEFIIIIFVHKQAKRRGQMGDRKLKINTNKTFITILSICKKASKLQYMPF